MKKIYVYIGLVLVAVMGIFPAPAFDRWFFAALGFPAANIQSEAFYAFETAKEMIFMLLGVFIGAMIERKFD